MASFRTGFKIFGELSIKQGLGRIRSFSEDRKPGRWLPEDQWAVRQPGSTCPEPCDKPKKPPKPSKSWLSVCKDPEVPVECDIRHNNCPPPPAKPEGPWYSLDNLIPKKKPEKTPPLRCCREEMKRRELFGEEEEVCENIVDRTFIVDIKPEPSDCCAPKAEPSPAPVISLSSPVPKDLTLMLWCEKPTMDTSKLPIKCQSDKLPYQEFRPQKVWKPPPFSLPNKSDPPSMQSFGCKIDPIPFAEFKHVEVPKPMYTRYKSVELSDCNFLMSMIDVKCPENESKYSMAITHIPNPKVAPQPVEVCKKKDPCLEKPLIQAGSCRPVRLKNAPKYTFRPKPTKLIEKRVFKNPCAQHKSCDSEFRHEERECEEENEFGPARCFSTCDPPKIITGTLTCEPQTYQRNFHLSNDPPKWMYFLSKPGSKDTPLIPCSREYPEEPDWCSETDGLNFYDGNDEGLYPKPPPYPCCEKPVPVECVPPQPPCDPQPEVQEVEMTHFKNRFVLMPECFNIRNTRTEDSMRDEPDSSFEQFIEAKTASAVKCSKSYPPMKENILYDLQRLCPNIPFDPTKFNPPCRKPPKQECPPLPTNQRCYSTLSPATFRNVCSAELFKTLRRTECGDSSGKCKVRGLVPKAKECPEKPKPTKRYRNRGHMDFRERNLYASKLKCSTLKPSQNSSGLSQERTKTMLGLKDFDDNSLYEYEQKSILPNPRRKEIATAGDEKKSVKESKPRKSKENALILQEPNSNINCPNINCPNINEINPAIIQENQKAFSDFNAAHEAENEDNSKAFMGSFGSWINDLFSVPGKKSNIPTKKIEPKPIHHHKEIFTEEDDSDYFKSVNLLKEKFRKKLRRETSIHVLNGDKLLQLNFTKRNEKKPKKKTKSLPSFGLLEPEIVVEDQQRRTAIRNDPKEKSVRMDQLDDLSLITDELKRRDISLQLFRSNNSLDFNQLSLEKEKRRHRRRDRSDVLEEYILPTPAELSKSLLLNVDSKERNSHFCKNSHLGKPEPPQHYVQRKSKSYQNSTRCYTTNAILVENQENFVSKRKPRNLAGKINKKILSEFAREKSTFIKVARSNKLMNNSQIDLTKTDSKATSDDLVKYLMKKVKVQPRSQSSKKKTPAIGGINPSKLPPTVTTNKMKFMQSATSSLVMNVLARKENDLLWMTKHNPRNASDKNDLMNKPTLSSKTWSTKYNEGNIRIDMERQNRFNRNSYLSEQGIGSESDNYFFDRNMKNAKRYHDSPLKAESRETEKYNKRKEIKNMLSEFDVNSNLYRLNKFKQKEQKKKAAQSMASNLIPEPDPKDTQLGRFQQQHELFKNSFKTANLHNPNLESDLDVNGNESEPDSKMASLSTELAVVDKHFELVPDESSDTLKYETAEENNCEESPNEHGRESSHLQKVANCYNVDDSSSSSDRHVRQSSDKQIVFKDKLYKTKSLQFMNDDNSECFLSSPVSETGNRTSEPSKHKEIITVYDTPLSTPELRKTAKGVDTVLLNRRHSSNSLNESPRQKQKALALNYNAYVASFVDNDSERCHDGDRRQARDKKKDRRKNDKPAMKHGGNNNNSSSNSNNNDCSFDKIKKPEPNCKDDDVSST